MRYEVWDLTRTPQLDQDFSDYWEAVGYLLTARRLAVKYKYASKSQAEHMIILVVRDLSIDS